MSEYRLPDGTVPVLLSSDTAEGLRAEAAAILAYSDAHPRVSPDRLATQLFRTRIVRRYRALAMVSTRDELPDALRSVVAGRAHPAVVTSDGDVAARRVGFVFPGQGSQRAGMGKPYYDFSPAYRAAVDECAAMHEEQYGHARPVHYLLGAGADYSETLWEVQPARMFHLIGLAAMWQAAGVRPTATIGHSQGELAACVVAGALPLRDAVSIVTQRARLLERDLSDGYAVAVLGAGRDECEALLARNSGWAEVSLVNSPAMTGVSGDEAAIAELVATATAKGLFAKQIQMSFPSHTSAMTRLRDEFQSILGELSGKTFAIGEIACYGGTLGAAISPELTHHDYWYWNLRNRVRFDRAVVAATRDVDTFVEIAEHPTLQPALRENLSQPAGDRDFRIVGTSLRTADGLAEFTRNLAEIAVHDLHYDWQALRTESDDRPPALPLRDFPATVMNPKRLWAPYQSGTEAQAPVVVPPARLREEWTRLSRFALTQPRTMLLAEHDGRADALAAAMRARAARHGAAVADVAAEADTVVLLLPPTAATDEEGAVAELAAFAAAADDLAAIAPDVTECWLVTTGAETVTTGDVPSLGHSAISAAYRSLGLDSLGIAFRHLDLPPEAATHDPTALADKILEAVHLPDEPELALRDGKLYAKRLVHAETTGASAAPDLREVLILGGTGYVGLEFCAQLARDGARRITLVNRSGETSALADRLRVIRAVGSAEIDVVACDLTDVAAVAELARRFTERPVSVVVHAAVRYAWARWEPAAVAEAAAAKVLGLGEVLRAVPQTADCAVLLCSSFVATLGGRDQALYAATNRLLDSLAVRLRAQGKDCVSVQWGLWGLPGAEHADVEARILGAGLRPMPASSAIAAGFADRACNSMVLSADWARLRETAEIVGLANVFAPLWAAAEPVATPPEPSASPPSAVAEPEADVAASFAQIVRREVGQVMLLDGSEHIDGSVPLVALGFDSLQAVDLRARLKTMVHRELPVAAVLGGASLDDVVELMSENRG
ncbi:nocobactin polyketide synthase NbtC [Nocardia araoensis]|uniref:nocobactin polyketide synthase NbtC n=1 Tax=Nocardia araoensis TaxID=228600 RepID=UPI0002E2661E|nr:nocobactin polyketide synthase NbtC [Nocardia araoensis]